MGMPLDVLVAEASGPVLLDGYTEDGVLLFSASNNLWLAVGLYSGSDGKAYCTRRIKLCIDPSLPSDEEFNGMFVNRNGSRVALSSAHSVFVIEMPNDIWCRRAVTVNPLTEHLQSAYHCRSKNVGSNVSSKRTAAIILKIRWYWKDRYDYGHQVCSRLGVLHYGNIVRIYDTDVACATPALMVDFNSILGLSDLNSSRSLGIFNYIASFDFGPSFLFSDGENCEQTRLKTLLAVDSDCSDIYIAVYSDSRVHEVQGPLALTGTERADSAIGDAFDVLYVQYHENTTIPVFSLLYSTGHVTHFVAVVANLANPTQPGKYFVLCGANLFLIDIGCWAYLLSNLLLAGADFEKSADSLLSSKVQHVFRVVGSSEACGIEDAVMAAATIDVNDECIDGIYKAFGDRSIAYIAATSSKQLLSKFTRQEEVWDDRRTVTGRRIVREKENIQNYLIEECEKIFQSQVMVPKFRLNSSVTEAEAIVIAKSVIDALVTNMKVTKTAFAKAQNIISEDLKNFEKLNKDNSLCTERLLRVLSAYVDLKNRIYKIQRTVAKLKQRSDEIGSGLIPKMFPLTDAERALERKLETLHVNVDGIIRQLPHIANEVALKRRERFGPARSFCASVSARKFVLSKNTDDINEMVNWMKQLSKKIDSIQTEFVTTESLSASPKPRPQF